MSELMPPEGWDVVDGRFRREFVFPDFPRAFAFMTASAIIAEKMDHHPNWSNVYNRVTVELWSHDVGGISDRDVRLAEFMNGLAT